MSVFIGVGGIYAANLTSNLVNLLVSCTCSCQYFQGLLLQVAMLFLALPIG